MADAGIKLTVEGEKEYKQAMKDINAVLKLNQSEMQKATAEFNANNQSMAAMAAASGDMEKAIESQTECVTAMQAEYDRLTEEYGENSTGAVKLKTELNKATVTLESMKEQSNKVKDAMAAATAAMEDMESATEEANEILKEHNSTSETAKTKTADLKNSMKNAEEQAEKNSDAYSDLWSELEGVAESTGLLTGESKELFDKLKTGIETFTKLQTALLNFQKQTEKNTDSMGGFRDAIIKTASSIGDMGDGMGKSTEAISEAVGTATNLGKTFTGIGDVINTDVTGGLSSMVSLLGEAGVAAAAAAAAVGTIKAAAEMSDAAIEYATGSYEEIDEAARAYGLTDEDVQRWQYVATQLGISFDSIGSMLKELRENMYDTANGNEELAQRFAETGVAIFDETGNMRETEDVLLDLVQAFTLMTDAAERSAQMEDLLGGSTADLNALIYAGASELSTLLERAEERYVLSQAQVALLEQELQTEREIEAIEEHIAELKGVYAAADKKARTEGLNVLESIPARFQEVATLYEIISLKADEVAMKYGGIIGKLAEKLSERASTEAESATNIYNVTVDASNLTELTKLLAKTALAETISRMK